MKLKIRREISALETKVKEHCAVNQAFRSDLSEWIEVQKDILAERLIAQNDENVRGMIWMLDGIKKDFSLGS